MSARWWGLWGAALCLAGVVLAVEANSGHGDGPAGQPRAMSVAKTPDCSPDDPSEPANTLLRAPDQAKQALATAAEVSLIVGCRMRAAALDARESVERAVSFQPARCAILAELGVPASFPGAAEPPVSVRYASRRDKSGRSAWTVAEHVGLYPDSRSAEAAFGEFRDALRQCGSFRRIVGDRVSSYRLAQAASGPDWATWSPSTPEGADGRSCPFLVGRKGNVLYQFDVARRPAPGNGQDKDLLEALAGLSRAKIPG